MTTKNRAEKAKKYLLEKNTNHRKFDDCFENGDGEKVVILLMEEAQSNQELKKAILSFGAFSQWNELFQTTNKQLNLL